MYFRWVLIVFILLCLIHTSLSDASHWDYGHVGPEVWEDSYPICQGKVQSPINILTACTVYNAFPAFQFSPATNATQNFTITNNGHTITATQVDKNAFPLTLSGGGLNETYQFANFHLHWGENYKSGSEHQINGDNYAGEIHFVYSNSTTKRNAVLGIFIKSSKPNAHTRRKKRITREINSTDNSTVIAWEQYFSTADQLNSTNDTNLISLQLSILMNTNLDKFYRYTGSLTTPPCDETVTWTVFQTPIELSDDELELFRTYILSENSRSPQPLNGRIVYRSFQNDLPSTDTCCSPTVGKGSRGSRLMYHSYFFIFLFLFFFNS
ncbi:unnamed protein product [Rotaria sordida]|uniref:Carbonic anhydrase n=1 Tax=Rotaria sordida TaxID=392033 RepID=A0A819M7Q5_9BILA|nr:unnamed protein product [Rotaria sordida]CAF3975271.1 unnamed protein product [Rotaria sordida]